MNTKLTIADIAYHNESVGGHYFDRKTLKCFGQTRKGFSRKLLADGRIYLEASRWDGKRYMGLSQAIYDPATGRICSLPYDETEKQAIIAQL